MAYILCQSAPPKVAEVVKCLDTDFDSDSRAFLTFHGASLSDIISPARLSSAGGKERLKCNVHFLRYYLCQQPCRLDEKVGGASVPCVAEPGLPCSPPPPHPNLLDRTATCSQPRLSGARAGRTREGREKVEAEAERMRRGTDTVRERERKRAGNVDRRGVEGGFERGGGAAIARGRESRCSVSNLPLWDGGVRTV